MRQHTNYGDNTNDSLKQCGACLGITKAVYKLKSNTRPLNYITIVVKRFKNGLDKQKYENY